MESGVVYCAVLKTVEALVLSRAWPIAEVARDGTLLQTCVPLVGDPEAVVEWETPPIQAGCAHAAFLLYSTHQAICNGMYYYALSV